MTTVVACRPLKTMIADSNVSHGEVRFKSTRKIQRVGKFLVGVAGDYSHALRYVKEVVAPAVRGGDGRSVPLLAKMEGEFEVMLMSEHGLYLVGDDGTPLEIEDEFYVIGTGSVPAFASLRTQQRLMATYDLQMAMDVACEFDNDSRQPAVVLQLGRKRRNDAVGDAERAGEVGDEAGG